jgi:mRNA interferase YafQ
MSQIVISSKFKRAFRKFARRNTQLQARIEETIIELSNDLFNPLLGTHKLEGKLSGLLSCSCGYDCRIIFSIETDKDTNETIIVLLDVGSHDEVY